MANDGVASSLMKSIFYMTAMIGWLAYYEALLRSRSTDPKQVMYEQIVSAINSRVSSETPFGERHQASKVELKQEFPEVAKES